MCTGLVYQCKSSIRLRRPPGEYVWNKYRHPRFPVAYAVAKGNVRTWIAGKRYIPQQKSPRKDKSVGCPPGDGNSLGVAWTFPVTGRLGTNGTLKNPKKTVFREIRPLNGNFSGIWNHMSRASTWIRVRGKFGGNRSKESRTRHKKTTPLWPIFFALSPKPIARFRCKRARLSLFRPQPHLPSFIPIHPSFRDLLAKTTFQIVTIYGDPIG